MITSIDTFGTPLRINIFGIFTIVEFGFNCPDCLFKFCHRFIYCLLIGIWIIQDVLSMLDCVIQSRLLILKTRRKIGYNLRLPERGIGLTLN